MLKSNIFLLIVLFIISNSSLGYSQQSKQTKNILILFGQAQSSPAYIGMLEGIRQKLTEEFGDSYNLYKEFLAVENYPRDNYPKEKFNLYNEKYRDLKLDLLICIGTNIINPVKKNAAEYLLNLPAVSIDFDYSNYGIETNLKLNDNTAVIPIKFNIEKSLSSAINLFPATTTIYFIGGNALLDQLLMSISLEAEKKMVSRKEIKILTDLSMENILKQVRNLPAHSLIYIPRFGEDINSVPYYNTEGIRLISKAGNAPVFHITNFGIGDGAVGGYVVSFDRINQLLGESVVKMLNGVHPNSIKVTEQDYYEYIFDWRQLKKWNLVNSDLLPSGSTIMYEDISFVGKYKWVIGVVLLFLVLQSLLIANLIRLNRNQKLMTRKIIETENKYREFLHEDRTLRLGQLTASLSHELNQPLTAILSTAQAGINFINSNEATPELLKQILQKIVENDKRTASILSSVRGMLKLESREKENVNLVSLIDEVVAVVQSEAAELNTKLNIDIIHDRVNVLADKIQIQQVILNLITNALQSLEKSNRPKKEITITDSIGNNEVTISIRDSGVGIEESIKEKLFKPFVSAKKEGTGIGLTICRSIIEDHQGKIWAENMPDGGAKFSFSLKILKDE